MPVKHFIQKLTTNTTLVLKHLDRYKEIMYIFIDRIIGWFVLEGTFKDHLVQPSGHCIHCQLNVILNIQIL